MTQGSDSPVLKPLKGSGPHILIFEKCVLKCLFKVSYVWGEELSRVFPCVFLSSFLFHGALILFLFTILSPALVSHVIWKFLFSIERRMQP